MDYEVTFQQWQSTDRMDLIQQTLEVDDFIQLTVNSIDKIITHSYVAKCQGSYVNGRKDTVLALADFAENYTLIVHNEVESYFWNKRYCTLHPVVIYFKKENELLHQSICFLSDDLEHDTNFAYEIQCEICRFIKEEMPLVVQVDYFSDGCANQYKNYKNMFNLCHHEEDFKLRVIWNFFATIHGESVCDGLGGTVNV